MSLRDSAVSNSFLSILDKTLGTLQKTKKLVPSVTAFQWHSDKEWKIK